jgi:alpha-L-fucosidase
MYRNSRVLISSTTVLSLFVAAMNSAQIRGDDPSVSKVRYEPTWESLSQHGPAPKWYQDAVFGIYFHWGVYSVPAFGGEKYARDMYREKSRSYKHHCEKYGHPTE